MTARRLRHRAHSSKVVGPLDAAPSPAPLRRLDRVGYGVGARLLELLSWRERVMRRKPEVWAWRGLARPAGGGQALRAALAAGVPAAPAAAVHVCHRSRGPLEEARSVLAGTQSNAAHSGGGRGCGEHSLCGADAGCRARGSQQTRASPRDSDARRCWTCCASSRAAHGPTSSTSRPRSCSRAPR